jgi:hypothetical protein
MRLYLTIHRYAVIMQSSWDLRDCISWSTGWI